MRLMVITHDFQRCSHLSEFLSARGHEVLVPPHQQDVTSMVKQTTPQAIVVDLFMTSPNGVETIRALRTAGYKGKLIALAGKSAYTSWADCWRIGVDQVVTGVQATGEPLDPGYVEASIRASFETEIAQRAQQLWIQYGRPAGQDGRHWAQAKREVFGA